MITNIKHRHEKREWDPESVFFGLSLRFSAKQAKYLRGLVSSNIKLIFIWQE